MEQVTPGRRAEYVSPCIGSVESGVLGGSLLIASSFSVKEKKLLPESMDKGEGVEV